MVLLTQPLIFLDSFGRTSLLKIEIANASNGLTDVEEAVLLALIAQEHVYIEAGGTTESWQTWNLNSLICCTCRQTNSHVSDSELADLQSYGYTAWQTSHPPTTQDLLHA